MTKIDTLITRSRDLLQNIQFSRFGHRCPCCHLPHHSVKCLLGVLLDDLSTALAATNVDVDVKPNRKPAKNAKSHKNSGEGE